MRKTILFSSLILICLIFGSLPLQGQIIKDDVVKAEPPTCKIESSQFFPASALIDSDFLLFPNPARTEVNVAFCLQEAAEVRINLFSDMGEEFAKELYCDLAMPGTQHLKFNIEKIPEGIYVMIFRIDEMIWYVAELAIDKKKDEIPSL